MNSVDPSFVERYQLLLERDPRSKGFAALAEAYRKMGMLPEAESTCLKGLKNHPKFASGRVALAKIYMDMQDFEKALAELDKALESSPENLLAHSLKGEVLLELRRPKQALKAYKMALLFNPSDAKATQAIINLESLTADEYEEDLFAFKPLSPSALQVAPSAEAQNREPSIPSRRQYEIERSVSLADAFIVRNDLEKAIETLTQAKRRWGEDPEIARRLQILGLDGSPEPILAPLQQASNPLDSQILLLSRLLQQIEARKFLG